MYPSQGSGSRPRAGDEGTHAPPFGAIWPSDRLPSRGPTISPTAMQAQTNTPMDLTPTASSGIRRETSSASMSTEDPRSTFSMVNNSMAAPPQRVTWSFPQNDDFPPLGRSTSTPTYGNMAAHGKSPSATSSSFLEDGIFEPGSTYQTLHQTLRSHVFRAAYSTPAPFQTDYHVYADSPASSGVDSVLPGKPSAAHDTAESTDVNTSFELDAALEFKLWKAWTEEISNWVGLSPSPSLECSMGRFGKFAQWAACCYPRHPAIWLQLRAC